MVIGIIIEAISITAIILITLSFFIEPKKPAIHFEDTGVNSRRIVNQLLRQEKKARKKHVQGHRHRR